MAKQKYTKGVTPCGEALFAHLFKTEVFNNNDTGQPKDTGKYTVMLKLGEKETKELLTKIDDEWEAYKTQADKKTYRGEYGNGTKEYKGETYFKFAANANITCKDGKILQRTVPIFDTALKEISKSLNNIGNGSKIKVAYELVPYDMGRNGHGISLRLTAIQLIEYVEYNAFMSGEAVGFEMQDGFKIDDIEVNTEENNEEEPNEIEGDF